MSSTLGLWQRAEHGCEWGGEAGWEGENWCFTPSATEAISRQSTRPCKSLSHQAWRKRGVVGGINTALLFYPNQRRVVVVTASWSLLEGEFCAKQLCILYEKGKNLWEEASLVVRAKALEPGHERSVRFDTRVKKLTFPGWPTWLIRESRKKKR